MDDGGFDDGGDDVDAVYNGQALKCASFVGSLIVMINRFCLFAVVQVNIQGRISCKW